MEQGNKLYIASLGHGMGATGHSGHTLLSVDATNYKKLTINSGFYTVYAGDEYLKISDQTGNLYYSQSGGVSNLVIDISNSTKVSIDLFTTNNAMLSGISFE